LRGVKSNSIIGFLHTNFTQLIKLAKKDYVVLLIIFSVALISCGYSAYGVFVDTVVPTGVPLMESLRERWIHIQDVGEYIKMVEGEPAISPFRFRILTPFLVRLLVEVSHVAPSLTIRSVKYIVPKQKSYKIENPFSMWGWINARKLHPLCKGIEI